VTKQLQIDYEVFTAKQLRVSTDSMVTSKTKFEGALLSIEGSTYVGVAEDFAERYIVIAC